MLDGGRDDVLPVPCRRGQPENRQVVAFRRAAREDDIAAAGRRRPRPRDRAPVRPPRGRGGPTRACGCRRCRSLRPGSAASRRGPGDRAASSRRNRDRWASPAPSCTRASTKPDLDCRRTPRARLATVPVRRGRDRRRPLPTLGGHPARRRRRPQHDRSPTTSIQDACRADGVAVLRRFSGGGAVVLGPGCLNYAIALSLVSRPELADVAASFRAILGRVAAALGVPGLSIAGARRPRAATGGRSPETRSAAAAARSCITARCCTTSIPACRPLPEGARPPAGVPRRPTARGVHRQSSALGRDDPARLRALEPACRAVQDVRPLAHGLCCAASALR